MVFVKESSMVIRVIFWLDYIWWHLWIGPVMWLQVESSRSLRKGFYRGVLLTKSLCKMVLARNCLHTSLCLSPSSLRDACTTYLIILTETTGHFTSYGMFAEDIKHRCVRIEGEGAAIFQLGAPRFPETQSHGVNQTPLSGAPYST